MSARFPEGCAGSLPAADPVCLFLPELATELATAQSTQNEEVEQKRSQLRRLQNELKIGNERLESVTVCMCATNRAITVAKYEAAQANLRCRSLEQSLTRLVGEREETRAQLEAVGQERERAQRQRESYRRKMELHRERVSRAEENCRAHQELAALQARKLELERKRASHLCGEGLEILRGERRRRLQESIISTETACALVAEEMSGMRERKREGEKKINSLRKEVDVGKRRRQAQLTRIHRQLQEAQARRRQWGRQVASLHATISVLREKLSLV